MQPDAAARADHFSLGFSAERRFMLNELNVYRLAMALPSQIGYWCASAGLLGGGDYKQFQTRLGYARKLGKAALGLAFIYDHVSISGYPPGRALGYAISASSVLTERVRWGIGAAHPGLPGGKSNAFGWPATYYIGAGYTSTTGLFLGMQLSKTENLPIAAQAGMEYLFSGRVWVRTGIRTDITAFYFGLGYLIDGFRIDASYSLHPQLGGTPALSLLYATTKETP